MGRVQPRAQRGDLEGPGEATAGVRVHQHLFHSRGIMAVHSLSSALCSPWSGLWLTFPAGASLGGTLARAHVPVHGSVLGPVQGFQAGNQE